ncbi:MAG: SAM-dependent chlorinase/fluorinase [Gemmatimonadota bacterium]
MPLITFLSDFGTSDSYVGEVKGVLATLAPAAAVIDITHHIPPGDIRSASHILGRAWHRFPAGTVHLVVVDPGVGGTRSAIAVESGGHRFVGPDNGVLTPALYNAEPTIVEIAVPEGAAPTFHGRDLFAPAAARLALGDSVLSIGATVLGELTRLTDPVPWYQGKSVIGEVLYVDRFGNLVTNLTENLAPPYATLEVEDFAIGPVRRTFGDVPRGELLAYIGSGNTVEIAVRDGSASRRLGMGVGGRIRVRLG